MVKNGRLSVFNEGDGGRSEIIKNAIERVFKSYPIFGAGIGGVELIYGQSAHNFIIEVLCDYGIVGIMVFMVGFVSLFKKILKMQNKKIRIYFFILYIALFLIMPIPPTVITLHFVWVVIGLIIAFTNCELRGQIYESIDSN